jgi:MFS family permease
MQSSWAVGYALAAVANLVVQDVLGFNWRVVFFVGVLPALYAFWVARHVEEPAIWRAAKARATRTSLRSALGGRMLGVTLAVTLMNACALFAWWGLNSWVPAYLRATPQAGGIGLTDAAMNGFVVAMQVGMWFGYVTFGYVSDAAGRKRAYVAYLLLAAVAVCAYASTRTPWVLLLLGPVVAFLGTGHFSGFGAVTAELYPTEIRATAQGLTYNAGRVASAASPFLVGSLAQTHGFAAALLTTAAAFVLAAMWWLFIPETKGRAIG